jgi:hypothetical protein
VPSDAPTERGGYSIEPLLKIPRTTDTTDTTNDNPARTFVALVDLVRGSEQLQLYSLIRDIRVIRGFQLRRRFPAHRTNTEA